MQTREDRIFAHYRSLRRSPGRHAYRNGSTATIIWMPLARQWKMPIKELKRLVWTMQYKKNHE